MSVGISRKAKSGATLLEKSEEAIVPMIVRTIEPGVGKGLCFNRACNGGK